MVEIKVRGVKLYRSRGKLYAYHRATGKRIRAPFGTAAFLAEVERLNGAQPAAPRAGTLGALIAAYRRSPEFLELAPRTRRDYQKMFDYLKPLDGDPLVQITSAYVIDIRDAAFAAHKRRFANYVLAVLRLLLKWGAVRDLVDTNQAAAVPKLRRPRNMPPANRPWTDEEYEAAISAATGGLKTAIALGRFTGIPEGDMVRLPRSAYDGNWISWRRGKTGNPVDLPAHPELKAILDSSIILKSSGHAALPEDCPDRTPGGRPGNQSHCGSLPAESAGRTRPRTVSEAGPSGVEDVVRGVAKPPVIEAMTLVAGVKGRPYTESGFRAMFFRLIKSLREQGLVGPKLTFQGLRTTAATALAEAGCSTQTIMAVTGHSTEAMASHYTRQANRKEQAVAAVAKLRPRKK